MDTKTDFNLKNIIATLSLISNSVLKLDLNSVRWMPKLASIDDQSYAALTLQSLRATIGLLQADGLFFHYVIVISGMLPYNSNVTLQTIARNSES